MYYFFVSSSNLLIFVGRITRFSMTYSFILGFSLLVHRCHIPLNWGSQGVFSYVETIYWSTLWIYQTVSSELFFRISWNVIEEDSKSLSPGGKFKKSWQLFFLFICNKPVCSKKKKSDIDKKKKSDEKKRDAVSILNSLFQGHSLSVTLPQRFAYLNLIMFMWSSCHSLFPIPLLLLLFFFN